MITVDVEITGFSDAQRALNTMADELQFKAVRAGLRTAAKPIANEMRSRAKGRFKDAINTLQFRRGADRLRGVLGRVRIPLGGAALIIGPNKKVDGKSVAQLAHLQEFGTDPHTIAPRQGLSSFALNEIASGVVQHPGMPARPFMAPALSVQADIQGQFFVGLQRHLRRLARSR